MKILIADDNSVIRTLLCGLIEQMGHQVIAVTDGNEAWDILNKKNPPQIAILDWHMPRYTGFEICKKIKEKNDLNRIYLILLTGRNQTEDIVSGLSSGANDYIVKPFNAHELAARINVGIRSVLIENELIEQKNKVNSLSKMQAIGSICARVAHEINNPLGIVYLEVEQTLDELNSEKINKGLIASSLLSIKECSKRISELVLAMRLFVQEQPEEVFVKSTTFHLVDSTLELCQSYLDENNVILKVDQPEKNFEIEFKLGQLPKVLLNLIYNSVEAMRESQDKKIHISIQADVEQVEISVLDHGTGISENIHGVIFDPFFTTDPTGKRKGLGLSIARGIIEAHGGELTLDRDSSQTRFLIRFPRYQKSSAKMQLIA